MEGLALNIDTGEFSDFFRAAANKSSEEYLDHDSAR